MLLISTLLHAQTSYKAYLFAYFTGNDKSEEQIRFALSSDGYHYRALNGNQPVIASSTISSTGGVRDPHILRGADGKTFYMVATDMVSANGWNSNRAMVLLKSTDLIHWTSAVVNIQKRFPGNDSLLRVWAPQSIYDEAAGKYLIYFSMKHGRDPDKIYYAYANKDFTDLETTPKQLFVEPTNGACIDGDIVQKDGKFYLFFKTEGARTAGLKVAVSDKLTEGYVLRDEYVQQTTDPVEGSGVFRLNNSNDYILMYDVYTKGKYQFTKTSDLEHFKVIDEDISMDFHPRHGTVMPITIAEAERLAAKWSTPVKMRGTHNAALPGLYADPDILYSNKTGKYYIYPTSDGFTGWSGTYFKTFSSPDLVHWKDEGVILDLPRDVKWANRNAWAPTITEKKINGQYKYFYYFTAAQKIGVAVSDHPTGPFVDAGKPLIDQRPEGVKGGQQIDPDVFTDPKTGKSYLYWGNGYMAGAELNDDMVSIKSGTTKILTPDHSFREGTHVLYRKGIYYFLWSENDTRDADYRVRYGTSDSPLGKITIPANNLVIEKDTTQGIYATGHNSTIQVPGKDVWYIVYHRFSYPNGIHLGKAAGYNREVCIDTLVFNKDGSIRPVTPTHKGIQPVGQSAKQLASQEVLDIIYDVNRYWQAQHPVPGRAFWDVAAYHTGNMETYFLTKDPTFKKYSEDWAVHNQWMGAKSTDKAAWKYSYGERDEYVLFGDWQICFQTYIDLYKLQPAEQKIARAKEVMEYEMSTPRNDYWWWADGLYMVMPVMTQLYNITGNGLYLEKLQEYFQYANSIMYDSAEGLYYRDAKYVYPKHKSANGKKDFWARGDGWVFAGLAKVIKDLPVHTSNRKFYVQRFQRMAKAIRAAQQKEGYWTRSMLDAAHAPGPETSGTAFFTYGLLWGINNGVLNKQEYLPAAQAAWRYLTQTALQPDGRIGYVQPIGERAIPGQVVDKNSTSNFGVGAFLLAACEMHRWLNKK